MLLAEGEQSRRMGRLSADGAAPRKNLSTVSEMRRHAFPGATDEALTRCATGELTPEITLIRLLAQSFSEGETETVLGTAIWNALENRDAVRAERLAQVLKLWNRLRRRVRNAVHSL